MGACTIEFFGKYPEAEALARLYARMGDDQGAGAVELQSHRPLGRIVKVRP